MADSQRNDALQALIDEKEKQGMPAADALAAAQKEMGTSDMGTQDDVPSGPGGDSPAAPNSAQSQDSDSSGNNPFAVPGTGFINKIGNAAADYVKTHKIGAFGVQNREPEAPEAPAISSGEVKKPASKPADQPSLLTGDLSTEGKIKDRIGIKDEVARASASPAAAKVAVDHMDMAVEKLPPDQRPAIQERLEGLRQVYDDAQNRSQWGEVGERFGNALAALGASMYGLKHGYDMSGLKFDKTDWEKRYDRNLKEYELGVTDVEQQRREAAEEQMQSKNRQFEAGKANVQGANEAKRTEAVVGAENSRAAAQQKTEVSMKNAEMQNHYNEVVLSNLVKEKGLEGRQAKVAQQKMDKAFRELDNAQHAKTGDQRDTSMNNARGLMSEAGMSNEQIDQVTTEKSLFSRVFGGDGRAELSPKDTSDALQFFQRNGTTKERLDQYYQEQKGKGYQGSYSDMVKELMQRKVSQDAGR